MFSPKSSTFQTDPDALDLRAHRRKSVFKTALIYPVLHEASFTITNISNHGVNGRTAFSLSLREQLHFSFDGTDFLTAEVRWTNGQQTGLLAEDQLLWSGANDALLEKLTDTHEIRESRLMVEIAGTLVKSAPAMVGTVRNISDQGMMIELGNLREGTRLLVKARGKGARMGRVQWQSAGMVGVFFEGKNIT